MTGNQHPHDHDEPPTAERHPDATPLERDQHQHAPHTAGPRHTEGGPHGPEHHAHMVAEFRRRFVVSVLLTIPVLAFDETIQSVLRATGIPSPWAFRGQVWLVLGLSTVVYLYGGWPFLTGFAGEIRKRQPGMMTLISVAITAAYGYSAAVVFGLAGMPFFWELTTLIDIMLLGHWIEMRSVMGASAALESLVRLMPSEAHRLRPDGGIEDVPVAELGPGDRVLVKPGEKIPTDGAIVEGRTSINEAMLTGESRPIEKGEGDPTIGGSINGESAITVEVQKTGEQTYLAQVVELVRKAQESRSRTQDLANRAALWLTLVALGAGTGSLMFWLLYGETVNFAVTRGVTVMVIACPHALGLAVPLVVAVSTALSAGSGLLIRDRSAFERARNVQAIVFDKTGTLTEGRFGVTEVIPLGSLKEPEILRLAASLESRSEHPIAHGIVRSARERGVDYEAPRGFKAIPGKGAEGRIGQQNVKIVSPGYLREAGIEAGDERVREVAEQGKTIVYVLVDDRLEGAIGLADVIRPESHEAIRSLKEMGLQVMMLTGDAEAVARWVAEELGLNDYFAEVLPHEKSEKIKEVQDRGLITAMTGDGVNDAPALVQADIGIAIGAGTDVAIQSADIVLVRSDPRDATAIIALSRATYRKMIQNLWWAAGYNIVAIPLAAGVLYAWDFWLSPAVGAVLMAASTVIVAINARFLRVRRGEEAGALAFASEEQPKAAPRPREPTHARD